MKFLNQVFIYQDVQIEFQTLDDCLLYPTESIEPSTILIEIYIRKQHRLLSVYRRAFPKDIHPNHYKHFIKKFLEDSTYRKSFLKTGYSHWEGVIPYQDSSGVHINCRNLIDTLNQKKKVKFKDLAELKTFGKDSFSHMKIEELKRIVGMDTYTHIKEELKEEKLVLPCLRWIARGLSPHLAIYKIKVDLEIEKNKSQKNG